MSADEAALIARYFAALGAARPDVTLGIGDDAALLRAADGCELAMTTDTLVEGTHFLPGADPRSLGHRAAAVNLSDLAAMGADPCWALLSLTLPAADESWLQAFAVGCGALLRQHAVALIGGNLARGPLNIALTLTGMLPPGSALRRDGGRAGDLVCVSGTLGDAAAGLALERQAVSEVHGDGSSSDARAALLRRFRYPEPRVALGRALRGIASACIDVSDGLARDLGRLASASDCGALLAAAQVPLSPALQSETGDDALSQALYGGEDYELLFTVPEAGLERLRDAALSSGTAVSVIGTLQPGRGLWLQRAGGREPLIDAGFDHFS
jgi:thiamine-monophosphate kinase